MILFTVHRSLVRTVVGRVKDETLDRVVLILADALSRKLRTRSAGQREPGNAIGSIHHARDEGWQVGESEWLRSTPGRTRPATVPRQHFPFDTTGCR